MELFIILGTVISSMVDVIETSAFYTSAILDTSPILYTSITTEPTEPVEATPEDEDNIGIIVGVSVGVVLLIVAIVIVTSIAIIM